jgi:TRAP-type C4-dicarboxylate transport system substrate-binding protein
MDSTALKKKAENTVEDLDNKIQELKSKPVKEEYKSKHEEVIESLERIRDHVREIYESFEESGDENWNEFGQNVYEDLKDFDDRYTGVGSIFGHI